MCVLIDRVCTKGAMVLYGHAKRDKEVKKVLIEKLLTGYYQKGTETMEVTNNSEYNISQLFRSCNKNACEQVQNNEKYNPCF